MREKRQILPRTCRLGSDINGPEMPIRLELRDPRRDVAAYAAGELRAPSAAAARAAKIALASMIVIEAPFCSGPGWFISNGPPSPCIADDKTLCPIGIDAGALQNGAQKSALVPIDQSRSILRPGSEELARLHERRIRFERDLSRHLRQHP